MNRETVEKAVKRVYFALQPTIVVFTPGQEVPEQLANAVRSERILSLLEDRKEAGDAEVLVYLYTASFAFPLSDELTRIYAYLHSRVLGGSPADFRLEEYEKALLRQLRRWIYSQRQRREALRWKEIRRSPKFKKLLELATGDLQ